MFEARYEHLCITDGVPFAKTPEGVALTLDLYAPERPEGDDASLPVVFWVHGGGFRIGNDRKQSYIRNFCERFAKKGYLCVAPDYRVREKPFPREEVSGPLADAAQDVNRALNWVRENARTLNADVSRMAICGGSAGGMVVNTLCYGDSTAYPLADLTGIKAMVSLWGPPWSGSCVPRENGPAALFLHGTHDKTVAYEGSVSWAGTLSRAGVPCALIPLEGGGHTCMEFADEMDAILRLFFAHYLK